jgi:hypothetical protein
MTEDEEASMDAIILLDDDDRGRGAKTENLASLPASVSLDVCERYV